MLRRLAVLLCLALLPSLASAEVIRYVAPGGTFTGGTITTPLLLPEGTAANPSIAFTTNPDLGFYHLSPDVWSFSVNGVDRILFGDAIQTIIGVAPEVYLQGDSGFISFGSSKDLFLYRDAANTLALRNGTAGNQTNKLRIYSNYTDPANNNYLEMSADGGGPTLTTSGAGSGGVGLPWHIASGATYLWLDANLYPNPGGNIVLGYSGALFRDLYLTTSIEGSKTKALTEGAATAVTQIAVPQTAGSNSADAVVQWTVYASDGTDTQTRRGSTYLAAVNKAGTETCTVGDIGTPVVAVSAGTLTCTTSCITGLSDAVQFALDCTSSLTQTSLNALVRLDMDQPNTVTPQ